MASVYAALTVVGFTYNGTPVYLLYQRVLA